MKTLPRRIRDESGAVAITVAVLLIVMAGLSALVADMGYAYAVRRQLQAAADAAALAGCQELIQGASEAEVLAIAREYAETLNAVRPAEGLTMRSSPPDTEVGADYVKVTVEKPMTLFFGRIFTDETRTITAQSKARIAYLTGLRNLTPWALPVIRATRVTATLNGVTTELALDGDVWRGTIPLPTAANTSGYVLRVTAYNSQTAYPDGTTDPAYHPQGVAEVVGQAAAVVVPPLASGLIDVRLDRYVVDSGDGVFTVSVESTTKPTVRFDGKNYSLTETAPGSGVWRVTLSVPSIEELVKSFPVEVEVGTGSNKVQFPNAAYLVVRRPTYPILDVRLSRYVTAPGEGGSAEAEVRMNDYVFGRRYTLKVVAGAEVGNFCALDFGLIKHTPNWRTQDPSEYDVPGGTNAYYDFVAGTFPYVVHVGDTIWTQTGNLSGPQTADALAQRFAGDARTFEQWVAAGMPGDSRRLIYVPIMEKVQSPTGNTPLRVVSFGVFYVEPDSDVKKADVVGRFVRYQAPSDDISDVPPAGLYVMTPRLVGDGIH